VAGSVEQMYSDVDWASTAPERLLKASTVHRAQRAAVVQAVGVLPAERRLLLETLLMFVALIGSFALVGLLVPFSENILRPLDDTPAADHRDNVQE